MIDVKLSKYRPVSLLTSFSKIFETVMLRRILKQLTKYNILSTEKYGFRVGLRTDNATYNLTTSDCVNHDILLSKLEFYGISVKDFQIHQSYLGNRYCRTATYNDSKNSNKVSYWSRVRHGVPQGSILGPLIFLLYINNLTKIINKTSAPIIFANDTSILFAHSNPIDFNKNIYIVFITLKQRLRVNQLSLNFNKTNYVHFTTKRNMSVNLKIGFNNKFITNSSYTKFLGVTMKNTLPWNNHIDLIMKKLN